MARLKKNKTSAVADTNMLDSKNQALVQALLAKGWNPEQLQSEIPVRKDSKYRIRKHPFVIFHRAIKNPCYKGKNQVEIGKNTPFLPISTISHVSQNQRWQAVSVSNLTGSSSTMGATHRQIRPHGSNLVADGRTEDTDLFPVPVDADSVSDTDGSLTASGVPGSVSNASGVPGSVSGDVSRTLSDITTIQRMRSDKQSFTLGFDSEFYYDDKGNRHILSWQFAFIQPEKPDEVQEILVFALSNETLPFSLILNYIIEKFGIYHSLSKLPDNNEGFSYFRTHRWLVPTKNEKGQIKARYFTSFEEAQRECVDPDLKNELSLITKWVKANTLIDDTPTGLEVHYEPSCHNFPVGYLNVYTEANKHAIPVTLVCHTGSADVTTLNYSNQYEKDMMLRLSQIQGGLMTLKSYYMHNPVLSNHKYFYPVDLSVRDTMGFAPAKKKSLANLGDVIGVPKLEVPDPYDKSDMLTYMVQQPVDFSEYAINDSVIALLYSSELWGTNKEMPITVSSASGKAAVPVIKEYFGLDKNDTEGFNQQYRGLKTVKKGLVPNPKNFGFLQNTALEPLDSDCELFQLFAKNSYKGGYNGSSRIGYYSEQTYDFDLENAYPTCMSLIPDVDWENCIAHEDTDKKLTRMMIPDPFAPVIGYVDFKFPDDVRYPCIPVTVNGSMIFPKTNEGYGSVYATAPELYLSLMLGADITVKRLFTANPKFLSDGSVSHSLFAVVKQFVNDRDLAKKWFGVKSLADLLLKEAVNSSYGKTAQDVIDKSSWSARKEMMVDIGGSPITSPYHATMTTAGVRCVLLSAMNQLESLGYKVYSVTTDGFISDAPEDVLVNLDLYGFTAKFQSARTALVGDPTMWAVKHQQNDLVNLTTRGNASLNTGDPDNDILPGVIAHNSYVTGFKSDSAEDRIAFVTAVLDRNGRLKSVSPSFAKFKNIASHKNRIDFFVSEQERMLSMDFDLKRKPMRGTLISEHPTIDGKTYEIGTFNTEPYETIAEYEYYKSVGRSMPVLRTLKDWVMYFDKIDSKQDGKRRIVKDLDWSILFSCVMAHRLKVPMSINNNKPMSIWYLESTSISVSEKCAWINKFNKSSKVFGPNDWKNARKQERLTQMLPEPMFIDLFNDMYFWSEHYVPDYILEEDISEEYIPDELVFKVPDDLYDIKGIVSYRVDDDGMPHCVNDDSVPD